MLILYLSIIKVH